jgi:hypothetical protein
VPGREALVDRLFSGAAVKVERRIGNHHHHGAS